MRCLSGTLHRVTTIEDPHATHVVCLFAGWAEASDPPAGPVLRGPGAAHRTALVTPAGSVPGHRGRCGAGALPAPRPALAPARWTLPRPTAWRADRSESTHPAHADPRAPLAAESRPP